MSKDHNKFSEQRLYPTDAATFKMSKDFFDLTLMVRSIVEKVFENWEISDTKWGTQTKNYILGCEWRHIAVNGIVSFSTAVEELTMPLTAKCLHPNMSIFGMAHLAIMSGISHFSNLALFNVHQQHVVLATTHYNPGNFRKRLIFVLFVILGSYEN